MVDILKMSETPGISEDHRQIMAIVFTDVKGFSKSMHKDEYSTLDTLWMHNDIIRECIQEFGGIEIKTIGDAFLVVFSSVINAVNCAIKIQGIFRTLNENKSLEEKLLVRVGIHFADVLIKDKDVYGDGVNIASRIMSIAHPGTINISERVHQELTNKPQYEFFNLGYPPLKNIKTPIRVYRIILNRKEDIPGIVKKLYFQIFTTKKKRWILTLALAVLLVVAFLTAKNYFVHRNNAVVVAFLPFQVDNNTALIRIADGFAEDIIRQLSLQTNISVISSSSSFLFNNAGLGLPDIGSKLGADYILQGQFKNGEDAYFCHLSLIEMSPFNTVWNESYTVVPDNLLLLRAKMIKDICRQLRQRDQNEHSTENPKSYESYLLGLAELQKRKKENVFSSLAYFDKAVKEDSTFAQAYNAYAMACLQIFEYRWDQNRDWLHEAESYCLQSLKLDSTLAETNGIYGWLLISRGKTELGIQKIERALQINPNDIIGLTLLGREYAFNRNNPSQALHYLIRAAVLDPMIPINMINLGIGYGMLRSYPQALKYFKKGLMLNPEDDEAWRALGVLYEKVFELDSARIAFQTSLAKNPENADAMQSLLSLLICTHNYQRADSIVERAIRYNPMDSRLYYLYGVNKSFLDQSRQAQKIWNDGLTIIQTDKNKSGNPPELMIDEAKFQARLGHSEEAISLLRQSWANNQGSSDIALGISEIFSILAMKDSTLHWLSEAKAMAPDIDAAYLSTSVDLMRYAKDAQFINAVKF